MKKNWLHLFATCALSGLLALAPLTTTLAQAIKWTSKAPLPAGAPGGSNAMCFTIGSKIYVGGGYYAPLTNSSEFYMYDTSTNVWTKKADLPGALNRSSGVAFAINGKGYIGLGAENFLDISGGAVLKNDLWEYDTLANTWTARAALPDTGRTYAGCFVLNNKAYVIGGNVTSGGFSTADVWEYDPVGNAWTARAPYPLGTIQSPFAFALSTSAGVRGYVACGSITGGNTKKTYEYNPTANSWAAKGDYPGSAIRGGVSFVINNKAYCGMGLMDFTNYTDTFYTYNPVSASWGVAITSFPADPCAFGVTASMGNKAFQGAGWKYAGGGTEIFTSDWYRVTDTAAVTTVNAVHADGVIALYPNPALQQFSIELAGSSVSAGEVHVIDITGKTYLTTTWQRGRNIDVSTLPAGNYMVRLITANNVHTARLQVQQR